MEKHLFKVLNTWDDDGLYHIVDLTDSAIVGVTECYETEDSFERKWAIERNKEIKAGKELAVKVKNYRIFISLDSYNSSSPKESEIEYVKSVLRQMATFFREEYIENNSKAFEEYKIPTRTRTTTSPNNAKPQNSQLKSEVCQSKEKKNLWAKIKESKWMKGWRLWLLISLLVILILFVVALIVFPAFREGVMKVIEIVVGLPLLIVMFIAYADDMFARR